DFGLAKRLGADGGGTLPGTVLGTPEDMAPEQAAGQQGLTTAADGYALGAVLYAPLTGRPPFRGGSLLETPPQGAAGAPAPPGSVTPRVPPGRETVCLKCRSKDPGQRYGSAEALAEELERFLAGEPVRARPLGWPGRAWRWCRRNPALAGALAAVVAALL